MNARDKLLQDTGKVLLDVMEKYIPIATFCTLFVVFMLEIIFRYFFVPLAWSSPCSPIFGPRCSAPAWHSVKILTQSLLCCTISPRHGERRSYASRLTCCSSALSP